MDMRIAAVILASGMSKRMGTTKQLMLVDGIPLLEYVIRKLLPFRFEKIVGIVGNQYDVIIKQIKIEDPRFEWKINDKFQEGQSTALKYGAKFVEDMDGMMVFLADQPLIQKETIRLIFNHAERLHTVQEKEFVVQPSYMENKGHPVFFSRSLFPFFKMLAGDKGGKQVIKRATNHHVIPVDDSGILFDVDTPEDYQKLVEVFRYRRKR